MTHDDNESGWDSLADELGIEPAKTPEHVPAPTRSEPERPAPIRPARDPRPEIEQEMDDFGAGLAEGPEPVAEAAMYDPGAGTIAEEDDFEESPEELFEEAEEGFAPPGSDAEGQDSGKRRRRRRRRKKKGEPEGGEAEEAPIPSEFAETDEVVEEGEAPAEVEDDDEPSGPTPAMEEELEDEVVGVRPEWHVMTWMELVSKLYRPN